MIGSVCLTVCLYVCLCSRSNVWHVVFDIRACTVESSKEITRNAMQSNISVLLSLIGKCLQLTLCKSQSRWRINVLKNQRSGKRAVLTYVHTLVIESTHKYKVRGSYTCSSNSPCPIGARAVINAPGPYGTWKVRTVWPMDLVFVGALLIDRLWEYIISASLANSLILSDPL